MREATKVLSRCLAAALFIVLTGSIAHSQPATPIDSLSHWWTWSMTTPYPNPSPLPVQVRDQFFGGPILVDTLERLLNPVYKIHGTQTFPPRNPELHYTWWRVRPPVRVDQTVVYYDQFFPQGQTVTVDTLAFLLTPASKRLQPPVPPPPPGENHYLCYRIFGIRPSATVGLQDQFRATQAPVLYPNYLCAPCYKQHGTAQYPPRDSTHLIFYEVNNPFPPRLPYIDDQFLEPHAIEVFQRPIEFLVTPARKQHISTPTKTSTWGRMKTLYR
jgi:hypothetical protein